jgi:hypothetical protein
MGILSIDSAQEDSFSTAHSLTTHSINQTDVLSQLLSFLHLWLMVTMQFRMPALWFLPILYLDWLDDKVLFREVGCVVISFYGLMRGSLSCLFNAIPWGHHNMVN